MKVLFDHANPFLLAHGGFQIQIEQTKIALEKTGVQVDWLRWWDPAQRGDLIHYFGRPHPSYIRQSKRKGLHVVMSELLTGLGSRGSAARFFQKWIIQVARFSLPREFTIRMSWDSYRLADRVIALTEWEKKLMEEQFSVPAEKVVVVPNGVEEVFLQMPKENMKEPYLITTMTITERKRSVELVEAAVLAQVKLRILGAPYHQEDPYYQRFLSTLRGAGALVEYVGGMTDRPQIANEYRKARGFVLLSAMESQSLSALEAAACGCPLLLSDLPWARVSFGAEASYAPVGPASTTAPYLRKFFENAPTSPHFQNVLSWDAVAERLLGVYREAITS